MNPEADPRSPSMFPPVLEAERVAGSVTAAAVAAAVAVTVGAAIESSKAMRRAASSY